MRLNCPHCQQVVEFSGQAPRFCGYCGQALPQNEPQTRTATALADVAGDATTLPPDPLGATVATMSLDQPGQQLAGYQLKRELGSGGMGVVWEAEQTGTGRRVALKLLSPGRDHSSEALDRFVREGRLAAALSHPRSTFVFEAGTHDGRPFICMELMPGRTLADVCREEGPLPLARAVDYILDVIEGLEAAHEAGVIHRDVKPSNCFLDSDGRIKVGDFGLSKSLVDDAHLTRTGAFMGTPMYAAPEQVRGSKVDERTDVYAVGATLYAMIAGRAPFSGTDAAAVIAQIACDPAPPLRRFRANVPEDLDRAIARSLEKEPSRRFPSVAELRQAILPFSSQGLMPAPPGRRLGAYILDVLIVTTVGIMVGLLIGMGAALTVAIRSQDALPMQIGDPTFRAVFVAVGWIVVTGTILYFALMEARTRGTLGKRLLKLRVVCADGSSPGLGRSFLRAALLPGLGFATMTVLMSIDPSAYFRHTALNRKEMLLQQLMSLLPVLPTALCLATMRGRNGYRGLHDLASGTRVVMPRPMTRPGWGTRIPIEKAQPFAEEGRFGPFEVRGVIGRCGDAVVVAAVDEILKRRAWIYVRPRSSPPMSAGRAHVSRPTRPRWLQGGECGDKRWDAFEAVFGVPWPDYPFVEWEYSRFALRDLAEELHAALADNTLPPTLSLHQVWLDISGRAKLLDAPLDHKTGDQQSAAALESPEIEAMKLLRDAVALCAYGPDRPVHVVEFVDELQKRPNDRTTLEWAADQLRALTERPGSLRWYDRLISAFVSFGVEYEVYMIGINLAALALLGVNDLSVIAAVVITTALVLPLIGGFWTRGGIAFSLVGIAVRRADGAPASRFRCAVRNLLAWATTLVAFTGYAAIAPVFVADTPPPNPYAPPQLSPEMLLATLANCSSMFLLLITVFGIIYSVASPKRGPQDYLAGTRLVPQ